MAKSYTNHHIVPQAYLKRFGVKSTGKRKSIRINVRLKGKNKFFEDSITNIASRKNYYDVTVKDDRKYWEKYFATNIEPLYGVELDNV